MTDIEWVDSALRELRKPDKQIARRVAVAVSKLAEDPRPQQSRPLHGRPGYRLRVARDHRVIYLIEDDTVVVVAVGHRSQIYD